MKKPLLILFATMLFGILNAQTDDNVHVVENKHTFVLGGAINFLTQHNTFPFSTSGINSGIGGIFSYNSADIKNTTFAVSPYFGKEINQNWLVGLQFNYRTENYTAYDVSISLPSYTFKFERSSHQFGIGIFGRYVFNPGQKFNFYLRPYFEYNQMNQ